MAERVANSAFELVIVLSQEKEPTRAIETARFGRGTFSNVIHADKSKGEYALYHGAAFPLQFATHCIDNLCGETVLDPFCGSGTTLIACHQTGRTGYGIELSEEYCALILDRLCDEIGEGAMLYDAE
jgi:site-specific DNA-methyltransferase (adenine-specific)